MASQFNVTLTGFDALDRELRKLAAEAGPKSINDELRKAIRDALKEIVLPQVKDLIPVDSGELEDAIRVRAVKRSRSALGYWVGFPEPLFQGDTFYGGFIEFGFTGRGGVKVEADSYLRAALYPNTDVVIDFVAARARRLIQRANSFA